MTKNVIFVNRKTKIAEAVGILFKNRLHSVPVVENKKIVGIITETDFFTKDSANLFLPSYITFLKQFNISGSLPQGAMGEEIKKLLNVTAEDIMTPKCTTVFEETSLSDLLEFFKTTRFTALPVTDESGCLAGIVTISDILDYVKIK